MILKIGKNELLVNMFYGLLLFSIIGYIGYYIYSFANSINVYNNFANFTIDNTIVYIFSTIIKFLKDIFMIGILLYYCTIEYKNNRKSILVFFLFLCYGTIIALFTGYGISILGGMRGYLYLFVLILFFRELKQDALSLSLIRKIILGGILINCIVTFEQAFRGTDGMIYLAGVGGFRFTGLFGGFAPCSAFAASACLFIYADAALFTVNRVYVVCSMLLCLMIEIMCGSRSGMICVMLIMCVGLFAMIKIKPLYRYSLMFVVLSAAFTIIIDFVESIADRGSIIEVQLESGRLHILNEIIIGLMNSPITFMFGNGLGAGSNTSVLMARENYNMGTQLILDGTFNTILYQFGMIGLMFFVFMLLVISYKIRKVNYNLKIAFGLVIFIEGITCNLFESFACLIILFITYKMMCNINSFRPDC